MLAIHNIDGTVEGWCVLFTDEKLEVWTLITAPSTFHDTVKNLLKIPIITIEESIDNANE